MRPTLLRASLIALCLLSFSATAAELDPKFVKEVETDAPGSADNALTGRYEGARILGQTVKEFDELTVPSGPSKGKPFAQDKRFTATTSAEGKVTRTIYVAPLGRSSLEVFNNYKNALKNKGYAPVFECAKDACGESFVELKYRWSDKAAQPIGANYNNIRNMLLQAVFDAINDTRYVLMKKGAAGSEAYAAIYAGVNSSTGFGASSEALNDRTSVLVELVEPKGMETRMVTLKADEISGDIAAEGRAVLYGILFDFDKSDIKPESEPQLQEMAKALSANPKLNVFIIGHTDNKGALDYNMQLSQRRAEAVVNALSTKHGVAAKRMQARGLASLAPVATNRTDEGRAKNRRVEMVEQ